MRLASFRPRLAAFMIDYALLNLVARAGGFAGKTLAVVMSQAHAEAQVVRVPVATVGEFFGAVFWLSVLMVLNYGVLQGLHGATVGKWVMGLRVVGRRGQPISIAQSFLRCGAYLISYLPMLMGFLAFFWSRRRQMWHDALCGTYVIQKSRGRMRAPAPVLYLPAPENVASRRDDRAA